MKNKNATFSIPCEVGKKSLSMGFVLIPETPFEEGMSISTWQEKKNENAT